MRHVVFMIYIIEYLYSPFYCKAGADFNIIDDERLTFTPGGPTEICLPFEVIDDDFLERDETAAVTLTSSVQRSEPTTLTITILDNDREFCD